jgi:hypothetical protein
MQVITKDSLKWDSEAMRRFTDNLNNLHWRFTRHFADRLFEKFNHKAGFIAGIIKDTILRPGQAFEYKIEDGIITRVSYEVLLQGGEAVHFTVSSDKTLITLWRVYVIGDKVYLTK